MFALSWSESTMKVELALSGEEESDGPTTDIALDEGRIEGTGAEKVFTNEGTANKCVPVCGAPDRRSKESKRARHQNPEASQNANLGRRERPQ